jgi:hypothetical protein
MIHVRKIRRSAAVCGHEMSRDAVRSTGTQHAQQGRRRRFSSEDGVEVGGGGGGGGDGSALWLL